MQFTRLRLTGFKSFVDPTELLIAPGLTGVVGPNGCGKSNLVEALRWVMGETSAKMMRGGEMDDVIFSGTTTRPPRNLAEVILSLDNAERDAPAGFNDHEELEVSRRIERGSGSTYRINGREVRARDVQLLFADSATGARSPALVSQGRVGGVIAAKPAERRLLLEEAAGIIGLHSRRHEAELRLRAAEANLARLDDVLVTLDAQLQNLKKQSRQASRYRNLSGHIRRAEALLLLIRWRRAEAQREQARARLDGAEALVAALTGSAARAATVQADTAAQLPELRQAEAEAAARLHRLIVARDGLAEEERRVTAAAEQARARIGQIAGDLERERALSADAGAAADRLDAERAAMAQAMAGEAEARARADAAFDDARARTDALDAEAARLTERIAGEDARRATLDEQIADLDARRERLARQAAEVAEPRTRLEAEVRESAALEAATRALREAEAALNDARARTDAAEAARAELQAAEGTARRELQEAEGQLARLEAESAALEALLAEEKAAKDQGDFWPKVIDRVTVAPGLEAALGAALGEDLIASTEPSAPAHWRLKPAEPTDPALAEGVEPLSRFVEAPAVLARRLAQIGVVATHADGDRLSGRLMPGQRLVSRDGGLWRWDGFTVGPGAPSAAETRLKQRNRLSELAAVIPGAREAADVARAGLAEAGARAEDSAERERLGREAARAAETRLAEVRETHARLSQAQAAAASRLSALADLAERLAAEIAETEARTGAARAERGRIGQVDSVRVRSQALRAELADARAELLHRQAERDRVAREAEARHARLAETSAELASWRERAEGAKARIAELEARIEAAGRELAAIEARPAELAARRGELFDLIARAEEERSAAADHLAEGERTLKEADAALKAEEARLADAREARVRAEARTEQAEGECRALVARVAERLDAEIAGLPEIAELKPEVEIPDLEEVERRLERLMRERETMGPVNLLAEQEADDISAQITTLQEEREDLISAIARLRRGIAELNREARERLLASFEKVDQHFQALFTRLFGGGRAHLSLIEAEDPLEAGLEIMASPPGKRLQVLSLLSGGEQALTALALLFAVFMTSPAPVCVLDEVDAPLDDANVDRFCTLIEELAGHSATRFLVVTHHRMTMARMDRLFGVTMAERGVSQIVSVDLGQAEGLRATA
ncbi:MAG: chromosome segregation protein SMC [Proteobacteria bacterium]|nr:chromosome segregation protein SMC [Pseudomonadota bacterium]